MIYQGFRNLEDFQNGFAEHYERFKSMYPDAELIDYLYELKKHYQNFHRDTFAINCRYDDSDEGKLEEWSFEKLLEIRKKSTTQCGTTSFADLMEHYLIEGLEWNFPFDQPNFVYLDFILEEPSNRGVPTYRFDYTAFDNYKKFGLAKIQRDIQRRIDEIEKTAAEIESAEPIDDYSRENNQKPKIKLILLDKLGVIDAIAASLIDEGNVTHLAQVISAITGEEAKTLRTYINALRSYTNAEHNSPYNSEKTVQEAERLWDKLKLKNKDTGK